MTLTSQLYELPTYTEFVDQKLVVEPLKGPQDTTKYLQRFPDELYHKAPESHLVRILQSLLGPSGVGWLKKNTLEARLKLEALGLEGFDLDAFYNNPFAFGRIIEEYWDQDPASLLPQEEWSIIQVKNDNYRSRAIDFMNGARAGNTPLGMKLVARSGLGHDAEIIEHYKYLFDIHSDDVLGFERYGQTSLLSEMVILPRQETPRSEEQRITITGDPTGGTFALLFNDQSSPAISYIQSVAIDERPVPRVVDRFDIQRALEAIPSIGEGGVEVTGGDDTFVVHFRGHLSYQNTPQITAVTSLTGGTSPNIRIQTLTTGVNSFDEVFHVSARDKHNLQTAIDRVRPVTTLPTIGTAKARQQQHTWKTVTATSEFTEVVRYVSGQSKVNWPSPNAHFWIEKNKEKEAPRIAQDRQYHHRGFYSPNQVTASSFHIGRFNSAQRKLSGFRYLADNTDDMLQFDPERILADYAEPLRVSTLTESNQNLINGIYPTEYLGLTGIPSVKYKDEQFWASQEALSGSEWVEIDLGQAQSVNFVAFEVSKKPINIDIGIEILDQVGTKEYVEVTPLDDYPSSVSYEAESENPWLYGEYHFQDPLGQIPITRYIKITFERRDSSFISDNPWSIEARNLRVGRNVTDY